MKLLLGTSQDLAANFFFSMNLKFCYILTRPVGMGPVDGLGSVIYFATFHSSTSGVGRHTWVASGPLTPASSLRINGRMEM
jgi:hypothetical protein